MDYRGATVIADYGHNADAMRALVAAVEALPAKQRSVVISGAGDRRDEDIREQTVILGTAFDDVFLFQDACQRGREDGECWPCCAKAWKAPAAPATSKRSAASSSPSMQRWRACSRVTSAWCWSTRWKKPWPICSAHPGRLIGISVQPRSRCHTRRLFSALSNCTTRMLRACAL